MGPYSGANGAGRPKNGASRLRSYLGNSIHNAIDNYVITSGFALHIVMYGSCQCLKGSYFAQLQLKVYLASANECCKCCNTFLEVYNYRGTRFNSAPKMMPGPPP